jgi:hypothetical protein
MKMLLGYDVHFPLLNRLESLVQQRPFYASPDLGWVTANYLDNAYIDRLLTIAKPYGVQRLIFDDPVSGEGGYFHWARDLPQNADLRSWLGEIARKIQSSGLRFGICVSSADREFLKSSECLSTFDASTVELYSETGHTILDGVGRSIGAGKLLYLYGDHLIQHSISLCSEKKPILVRIDRSGLPGETLAGWGNIFALSYHLLTGTDSAKSIEQYIEICFGQAEPVKRIFNLSRLAIDKSFRTLNSFSMMDRSCWPMDLAWYDKQLDLAGENHILFAPSAARVSEIDYEKIEALEAAHDAWKVLEQTGRAVGLKGFLWLEHYLLHLKTVCMVLRMLSRGYFKLRGHQTGKMIVADHVFRSVHKELYETICNKRAILGEFSTVEPKPMAGILADFQRYIDSRNAGKSTPENA